MQSNQIKSQTTNILANLQKKISKYLTPSYETSDLFDKSKAITKNHEEIIQNNKEFLKKNQSQDFIKTEAQNPGNQFDQLLHRRKKCQAKLHSMLLDHQIQESLRFQFSPNKIALQRSSYRTNNCQDLFSISSLKQVKSHALLPTSAQPSFLRIQKQLQKMQKKIQNLTKKVETKGSSKKLASKKEMIKQSKVSNFSKDKKSISKNKKQRNQSAASQSRFAKSKSPSANKGSSVEVNKRLSPKNTFKNQRQNSQQTINKQKAKKCQTDQTSLFAKLTNQKGKIHEHKELEGSKLKKVGLSKFNKNSKKTIQMAKKSNMQQKQKQPNVISFSTQNKNHIKVNLLQCESEHVL